MHKKKPTLTIVIPCHNEEQTVFQVLSELQAQTQKNFLLEKVVVVCDGCSDNTSRVAKKFQKKWSIVTVVDDGKRLGKAARLQQQFQKTTSDLLMCCDADISLQARNCIDTLVAHQQSCDAGLCVPAAIVVNAHTFIQKSIRAYEHFWTAVITSINQGQNVHTCLGCCMLLSKDCYQNITFPNTLVAEDHYLYFHVKKNNMQYAYCSTAEIGFQVAGTVREYLIQSLRYLDSGVESGEFDEELLKHEYSVPFKKKCAAYLHTFLHEPFYFIPALALQLTIRLYKVTQNRQVSPTWEHISSTKKAL